MSTARAHPPHDHSHVHNRHGHAHGQASAHAPERAHGAGDGRARRLLAAFVLTSVMMAAEVVGGLWSGSLALLADACHMLVDALALLLAVVAVQLAKRPADGRRSYGYGRLEVLAGFVNALAQFVLVAFIAWEAVLRLFHPPVIISGIMLSVAVAGLGVNVLILRIVHGHAHDDVNMASAALHVAGDLFGSIAAILAALLVHWKGWNVADPLLSLLVSLLIVGNAWRLLRRCAHILLEGVPEGVDLAAIAKALRVADPSISDIHHLHVWQLASGSRMATLHARLREGGNGAAAMIAINRVLAERFEIGHVTVQIEAEHCPDQALGQHDPP